MPQYPWYGGSGFNNAGKPFRIDQQGAGWQSARHGKDYGAAYGTPAIGANAAAAGASFRCANLPGTPASLSVALATTYTGLCLSNPAGNLLNLVLKRVGLAFKAVPADFLAVGLATGWSAAGVVTHTTSLSTHIIAAYVGAAASGGSVVGPAATGLVDSACTIVGTPTMDRWLTNSIVTANAPLGGSFDLEDGIIIPPGGYVCVAGNEALTSGLFASFAWEELAP